MKILYELDLQDDQKFKAGDFPDKIEILRQDQKPVVLKPVAISVQDLYSRANEAEKLLKKMRFIPQRFIGSAVREYFERFKQ